MLVCLVFPSLLFAQKDTCIISGKIEHSSLKPSTVVVDLLGTKPLMRFISAGENFTFKISAPADSIQIVGVRLTYFDTTGNIDGEGDLYLDTSRIFYQKVRLKDMVPLMLAPGEIRLTINDPAEKMLRPKLSGPQNTVDYQEKLSIPVRQINALLDENESKLRRARANGEDTIALKIGRTALLKQGFEINKKYIRDNPHSIVSIQALKMMGPGDPLSPKPLGELTILFNTLSPEIRNSKAGFAYLEKLKDLKKGL